MTREPGQAILHCATTVLAVSDTSSPSVNPSASPTIPMRAVQAANRLAQPLLKSVFHMAQTTSVVHAKEFASEGTL